RSTRLPPTAMILRRGHLRAHHSFPTRRSSDLFVGSAIMSLLGIAIGAPVGVLAGTFLSEYANTSWARPLGETVRFVNDILLSAPDRKSTRLNSSHVKSSYAVFSLKKNRFKVNS